MQVKNFILVKKFSDNSGDVTGGGLGGDLRNFKFFPKKNQVSPPLINACRVLLGGGQMQISKQNKTNEPQKNFLKIMFGGAPNQKKPMTFFLLGFEGGNKAPNPRFSPIFLGGGGPSF